MASLRELVSDHTTTIVRDADLGLYGSKCDCGWESDYLTDDREEAEREATQHEWQAA